MIGRKLLTVIGTSYSSDLLCDSKINTLSVLNLRLLGKYLSFKYMEQ
jgi:hypothetical protein